ESVLQHTSENACNALCALAEKVPQEMVEVLPEFVRLRTPFTENRLISICDHILRAPSNRSTKDAAAQFLRAIAQEPKHPGHRAHALSSLIEHREATRQD